MKVPGPGRGLESKTAGVRPGGFIKRVVPSRLCPAYLLRFAGHGYFKKHHQIMDPSLLPQP